MSSGIIITIIHVTENWPISHSCRKKKKPVILGVVTWSVSVGTGVGGDGEGGSQPWMGSPVIFTSQYSCPPPVRTADLYDRQDIAEMTACASESRS